MYHLFPLSVVPSGTPSSQPVYVDPAAEFHARLQSMTPAVFVTPALLGLNLLVFLAMFVGGVNLLEPPTESLIRWGANFGPDTVSAGQWWRLLTSMFLHGGLLHLAFNMYVLWQIGPLVERLLGNSGYLLIYLVSALAGGLVSLAWNPYSASVGASGAIFGIFGTLLGFLTMHRRGWIPEEVVSSLRNSALVFIGYNVVFGFVRSGTDVAAHAGGLAAGFLCGLLLSDTEKRRARNGILALGSAIVLVAGGSALPRPVDLRVELQKLQALEKKTLATFNGALQEVGSGKLRQSALADSIEKDVLPDWVREKDTLAKLIPRLRGKQHEVVTTLVQYMDARQQGWTMLVQGTRSNRVDLIRQGTLKQVEAVAVLKKLKSPAP